MLIQEKDTTGVGQKFVSMTMFVISNARTKNETDRFWQEAIEPS